ncbi:LSU ribosomal maturation GTPase [Candidatus Syntrophocurvum alkaliphilum]|uniref:Ribosome biogenesis GTPase A n=1 Tax=Candidatus Syntrophocurvum alkaliphilum TaxID=2293317 RepID=A0A6I6DFY2_9FIRM|nr:ribosome biogenesis GTPase YlqF [Candidatus Syntrophocurvum alkaliphilum]QGT99957.1 LSU ribosomal maturation GTPase [Candidatus Syntrophocurvum alkaliphilum]
MAINWYPGHMVKAKREIEENIKLVDIVLILVDARAPLSCRNMDLEEIAKKKKIIYVLNKKDLIKKEDTNKHLRNFKEEGFWVTAIDSIKGKGSKDVINTIKLAYKPLAEEMVKRGRRVRPARVMVVGVPNVGKSTFLNNLVGKKMAKTGAKPGLTRGKQWVRIREDIEFMDTPGLMWPKVESEEQGLKLALLSLVGENAYDNEEVAIFLVEYLKKTFSQTLKEKYKIESLDKEIGEILIEIARKRGHIYKGGDVNIQKTYQLILNDFRKGFLGKICLD